MDITEATGVWRVTDWNIENRKTRETRRVEHIPSAGAIANMPMNAFIKLCESAFNSGVWPPKKCGYCGSEYR